MSTTSLASNDDEEMCTFPSSSSSSSSSSSLVSVIVPTTTSRRQYHADLLQMFLWQSYDSKELVVLEEGDRAGDDQGSVFATGHPNVRYEYRVKSASFLLGEKRNELIRMAKGSIIAHFDDDDYYSPDYLQVMVEKMRKEKVSIVKLSGYFVYLVQAQMLGYWDQRRDSSFLPAHLRGEASQWSLDSASLHFSRFHGLHVKPQPYPPQPWDFGFTFMYTKDVHRKLGGFANLAIGEDSDFGKRGLSQGVAMLNYADDQGIAMKIMHSKTTSNAIAQYIVPLWFAQRLLGQQVLEFIQRADLKR